MKQNEIIAIIMDNNAQHTKERENIFTLFFLFPGNRLTIFNISFVVHYYSFVWQPLHFWVFLCQISHQIILRCERRTDRERESEGDN